MLPGYQVCHHRALNVNPHAQYEYMGRHQVSWRVNGTTESLACLHGPEFFKLPVRMVGLYISVLSSPLEPYGMLYTLSKCRSNAVLLYGACRNLHVSFDKRFQNETHQDGPSPPFGKMNPLTTLTVSSLEILQVLDPSNISNT